MRSDYEQQMVARDAELKRMREEVKKDTRGLAEVNEGSGFNADIFFKIDPMTGETTQKM